MEKNLFAILVRQMNKRSNNKGSSVVLVIVAIAFVGTLVSMSAFMSYYNWMGKYNDKQTKMNFYTAEESLTEITTGLQNVVSNAMTVAYAYALQNNTGSDMTTRKRNFEIMYEKQLIAQLKSSSDDKYSKSLLESYLKQTLWNPATMTGTKIETVDEYENPSGAENIIFKKDGGLVLRNIRLMHTDARGYVTYISTDIYLQLPDINLAVVSGVPEIENCSIIANNSLKLEGASLVTITGNVYGGKEEMFVSGDTALSFATKGNDPASTKYRLVANSVVVDNSTGAGGLNVSSNYDVWAENVQVQSGKLGLLGSSFIRDDLTVLGRDSEITLAGNYYGYGNEMYKPTNSSSILINGGNTSLNFKELKNLMLAGHAYVGARHYDPNATTPEDYVENPDDIVTGTGPDPTYNQNNKDLMMGESIGVKSNQLIYMVPVECMGYYAGTTEQYLAKNPITYSEYLTLTTTYKYKRDPITGEILCDPTTKEPIYEEDGAGNKVLQYEEVNLGIVANKIGKTLTSIGATYKPVFRRINGTVLVYYYLDFTSEQAANDFFSLYYKNDKENMDAYIKMYVKNIVWSDTASSTNSTLHLAGNAIKMNGTGELELVDDTLEADLAIDDVLSANRDKWYDTYLGYSKKMVSNTSLLTSDQLTNDIYTNLVVDNTEFDGIVPYKTQQYFTNGSVQALAINNHDAGVVTLNDLDNVNLIIASGDVAINDDFNGLVISAGTVNVLGGCRNITNDAVLVRKAMSAKDSNNKVAADLLRDGDAYISHMNSSVISVSSNDLESKIDREEDYIKLSELITFENWTKR